MTFIEPADWTFPYGPEYRWQKKRLSTKMPDPIRGSDHPRPGGLVERLLDEVEAGLLNPGVQ